MTPPDRGPAPGAGSFPHMPSLHALRLRRIFFRHLLVYSLVNALLVLAWVAAAVASEAWLPWPLLSLFGWGLLVQLHGWWAYGPGSREG